jgi:transforming growth factor-beta-induced protein
MTSSGPYTQSLNFTHMYDMPDLNGYIKPSITPNSLLDIISDKKNGFTFYGFLLEKSGLRELFNQLSFNYTVFIPNDITIKIKNLDDIFLNADMSYSRSIILSTMLDNKITTDLLMISEMIQLMTKSPPNNLNISYMNDIITINDIATVTQSNIEANNGLIHVIDNVIFPIVL